MGCFPYAEALVIAAALAACGGAQKPQSAPPANATDPAAPTESLDAEVVEGSSSDQETPQRARAQAIEQARAAGILGPEKLPATLDRAAIRTVVTSRIEAIRGCYEHRLRQQPTLAGTTRVEFTIGLDGKVTRASGSGFDPAVDGCVAKQIETLTFPKPASAELRVTYPFAFRPAS